MQRHFTRVISPGKIFTRNSGGILFSLSVVERINRLPRRSEGVRDRNISARHPLRPIRNIRFETVPFTATPKVSGCPSPPPPAVSFFPPWNRFFTRIRPINERRKLAGLGRISKGNGTRRLGEEEFAGSRRFFAGQKQRSSWFFPWIVVACPQPPSLQFRTAFFAVGSEPPPPPRARNAIYTGFLRISFNSAHDL